MRATLRSTACVSNTGAVSEASSVLSAPPPRLHWHGRSRYGSIQASVSEGGNAGELNRVHDERTVCEQMGVHPEQVVEDLEETKEGHAAHPGVRTNSMLVRIQGMTINEWAGKPAILAAKIRVQNRPPDPHVQDLHLQNTGNRKLLCACR